MIGSPSGLKPLGQGNVGFFPDRDLLIGRPHGRGDPVAATHHDALHDRLTAYDGFRGIVLFHFQVILMYWRFLTGEIIVGNTLEVNADAANRR